MIYMKNLENSWPSEGLEWQLKKNHWNGQYPIANANCKRGEKQTNLEDVKRN